MRMARKGARRSRSLVSAVALALPAHFAVLASPPAFAEEQTAIGNVDVAHGQGAVTVNEATQTTLTSEGKVVYEWDGIQQPAGHTLQFDQSGAGASALNRGIGQSPFQFFGTVKSNGTVVFANEAGVHFADGSSVEVYKLLAGAANMSDADFLAGNTIFRGAEGEVINEGTIEAFEVALFGERVANHGDIYVEDGKLLMLAGDAVWIRDHQSPIVIEVPIGQQRYGTTVETTAVENTGVIDAGEHGSVRLAAADGLAYAIRNQVVERIAKNAGEPAPDSGVIRAGTIEIAGGEGSGVEIGGTLDATREGKNAVGGQIDVFGQRILIDDDAHIDATGSEGGGRIRIGGDLGGSRDDLGGAQTAELLFVSESAEIRADADYAGDGGEVILWSDGHAYIHGEVSARGGEYAGDGGFVETSGKAYLEVTRAPEVFARAGRAVDPGGTWLIDPYDITIGTFDFTPEECDADPRCLDKGIDLDDLFFVNNPILFTAAESSYLNASTVSEALNDGSNVTITTATGTEDIGTQGGNIIVASDILPGETADENTSVTLQLRAANDIIVNADIGGGSDPTYENLNLAVQLLANDGASQPELPVEDGETENEFVGNLLLYGSIRSNRSDVILQGRDIVLNSGETIETEGGALLVAAIGSIDANTGTPNGGGDVSLYGDIDTSSSRVDELGDELAGGAVTLRAQWGTERLNGGPETSQVGGSVTIEGDIELGAHESGASALDVEGFGGDVTIDGAITSGGGDVKIVSIAVSDDSALEPGASEPGGTVTLSSTGSITTLGGDVRIEAVGELQGVDQSEDMENEVFVHGAIDTAPEEADRDNDGRVDTIGGNVVLRAQGKGVSDPSGYVEIVDGRTAPSSALITTRGGDVEVNFDAVDADGVPVGDSFATVRVAASIDAGVENEADLDVALEDASFGVVTIDSAGSLVVENAGAAGDPHTIRGQQVRLRSANRSPFEGSVRGDLEFVSNEANGEGPQIHARDIVLTAGADSSLGFFERQSRIVAGEVKLFGAEGATSSDPDYEGIRSLTYAQNAPIEGGDVLTPALNFVAAADEGDDAAGRDALDGLIYVIQSIAGTVTLDDPTKVAGNVPSAPEDDPEDFGVLLELRAEADASDGTPAIVLADPTVGSWADANLQTLDLTVNRGFTVNELLADNASLATDDLVISTGRRIDVTLDASLRIEDGAILEALDRLELHAARGGSAGDLVFGTEEGGDGSTIQLVSHDLTLWAGSGNGTARELSTDNRVQAAGDSPTPIEFNLGSDDDLTDDDFLAFEIRQEAALSDADLPDVDQFIVDSSTDSSEVGLIDYTLRSDSADITLGEEGGRKLQRTNLTLLARNGVNVDMGEGDPLDVRTLDVGGTSSFEVTQQLIEQFDFVGPAEAPDSPVAATFRAGVSEFGTLSFEERDDDALTTITAKEIRLVASDGAGGAGSEGGGTASRIELHDRVRFSGVGEDSVENFVFRQDQGMQILINEDGATSPLPDVATHFTVEEPQPVPEGEDPPLYAPGVYAVQSDDSTIQIVIDEFDPEADAGALPIATDRTIVSAPAVTLVRTDGEHVDLEHLLSADADTATLVEMRSEEIRLTASNEAFNVPDSNTGDFEVPDPDQDLARVIFGNTADKGLYVYGFGEQVFEPGAVLPAPEPVDLAIQSSAEVQNETIPAILSIVQDADFASDDLLELDRSGSGCGLGRGLDGTSDTACSDDRRRTSMLLTSFLGDIEISPDRVFGGRIVLDLPSSIQDDGQNSEKSARFIRFAGIDESDTAAVFFTESFEAVTAYGWEVGEPAPGDSTLDLTIQAADFMSLRAGASGRGDLGFHPGVTLQSEDIRLGAFGPSGRGSTNILLPIIDARTNAPVFDFLQPDTYAGTIRQDSNDDRFTVVQDGWVNSNRDRESSSVDRTLPDAATQIINAGLVDEGSGAPDKLFAYSLQSNRRGVYIGDLPNVAASRLLVLANFSELYDDDPDTVDRPGLIEIDHASGYASTVDIDFASAGIDRAALIGDEIQLIAGTDGLVNASGDVFYASNSSAGAPLLAFTIEQEKSFIDNEPEAIDGLGSTNLPDFFQFTNGLVGIDYTLRLRDSGTGSAKIQIGSDSADKVRGARLALEALDSVQIDVPEVLLEGLTLTSLEVREADADGNLTIEIGSIFEADPDNDPDVVATLIETGEDQLYDGLVTIKGNVELRGRDIEFTGDVANASVASGEHSGIDFITRSTVSFGGDVGCAMSAGDCVGDGVLGEEWAGEADPDAITDLWLDRFRVRFDADDEGDDALAFNGAGSQSVYAIDAEIYAISPSADFETLESEVVVIPEISSVYKTDSDPEDAQTESLVFYTRDLFRVGEGQKISVQGELEAHSKTQLSIGDVAALKTTLHVDESEGQIEILRRSAGAYLAPDGRRLEDAGVSFVTDELDMNLEPTLGGDGRPPLLSMEAPAIDGDDPNLEGFVLTAIDTEGSALSTSSFEWQFEDAPTALPALHAFGPPRDDISRTRVGREIAPPPLPWMPDEWRVADARRLRDLAVRPRERTVKEWNRYLAGAGIIDDIGSDSARRDGLVTVAQPRLLAADAERSIELYDKIFGEDGIRAPRVRATLADALERYRQSSGARRVVGFEFRRYVKNRPSSLFDAYQVFEDLDELFDNHRALGLTPGEYRPIQAAWLEQIQPEGISVDELAEAVHPSRYVRGTDILEIFGD